MLSFILSFLLGNNEPDFVKGASGPANPYDNSATGLGVSPAYLSQATASSAASSASGGSGVMIRKNAVDVASEAKLDFEDGDITWTVTDDPGNTQVKVTPAIGSSKVTSAMILDGTIVNADVNASAALAVNKFALKYDAGTLVGVGGGPNAATFTTAFTAAPTVVCHMLEDADDVAQNAGAGAPANGVAAARKSSITTTGFNAYHNQGGTRDISWIAIGV